MSLSVEQQRQLNIYLKQNPKVSREQAIAHLFGGGVLRALPPRV